MSFMKLNMTDNKRNFGTFYSSAHWICYVSYIYKIDD